MKFENILTIKTLYAIPFEEDTNKPKVYTLIVKSINKRYYLGNNTYTLDVLFPNGETRYLIIYDGYINNPEGDNISKPFINHFFKNPGWKVDSSDIEDYTDYLIFDNHDILIDEYVNLLNQRNEEIKTQINELFKELNINIDRIVYVKKQKYDQ